MGRPRRDPVYDPRIVLINGINYYIDWGRMKPGSSVFLKTLAPQSVVRRALARVENTLNIKLAAVARREFGRYGVRVWRLA